MHAPRARPLRPRARPDGLDSAVGLLHVKDMLVGGRDTSLEELARPLERVPESMLIDELLERLRKLREHFALVLDEHGTVVGLITLAILGFGVYSVFALKQELLPSIQAPAGLVTALHPSPWPDLVAAAGIAILNADSAADIFRAAAAERRAAQ